MTKIQLIRPPMDDWYTVAQLTDNLSHPVGLCLLAKKVMEKIPGAIVEIIDGYNKPIEQILNKIGNADFVGVTSIYSNYDNALKILEKAKNNHATTIIGGPNVTHLGMRILTNRPFVDYAVVNDGEEAFPEIISGIAGRNTPNLVYRDGNNVLESSIRRNSPLATLFDFENLETQDGWKPQSVPISGIRGCLKSQKDNRCDFCSIDHKLKTMQPELVWKQVRILKEHGFDYFWEVGETAFPEYLNALLKARPNDLADTKWKFYVCADLVTNDVVKTLKSLNTNEVQIGIETLNDDILKIVNKKARSYDNDTAIELLSDEGINIHAAIMYGLTGETPDSANKTFEYIKSLVDKYTNIKKISTSQAIPFIGTKMFDRLLENSCAIKEYNRDDKNLNKDDKFDYARLTRVYTKYFTSVDFHEMTTLVKKTRELMDGRGIGTSIDINH